MKFLFLRIGLLMTAVAADCSAGITYQVYEDDDCTKPKESVRTIEIDESSIEKYYNRCINHSSKSHSFVCNGVGIEHEFYNSLDCKELNDRNFYGWNTCYKDHDIYFKYVPVPKKKK